MTYKEEKKKVRKYADGWTLITFFCKPHDKKAKEKTKYRKTKKRVSEFQSINQCQGLLG